MHSYPDSEFSDALQRDSAWLRALALSLVRDRSRADDLVQQTWETALERDPVHPPRRAWLSRVLRNHFLQTRRGEIRRTAREEKFGCRAESARPDVQVARAEASRILLDAVLRLREPYRTTILQRYQEGLSAAKIAREEGVPAATVRARTLRGLQLLRAEVEPALGEDRGAAHSALLLIAGPPAMSALPKALGFSAASALLVAVAVAVAPSTESVNPMERFESGEFSDDAASLGPEQPAVATMQELQPTREPMQQSATATQTPGDRVITIRGRCVRAEDGQPLEGCRLSFHFSPGRSNGRNVMPLEDWVEPEDLTTASDGVFEYRLVNPPAVGHYTIGLVAEGRMKRRVDWADRYGTQLEDTDFGDVEFTRGTMLYGRIVDQDGVPVRGGSVRPDEVANQRLLETGEPVHLSTMVLEDGSYAFEYGLPPGPRGIDVRCKGYLFQGPHSIQVADHLGRQELNFVMKSMPFVEGVVRYENGSPAPGIRVRAILPQSGWTASASTDANGRFRVHDTKDIDQVFGLELTRRGITYERTEPIYHWGDRGVEFTIPATTYIDIDVVAADTGEPVEEFSIATRPNSETGGSSASGRPRAAGVHTGGRLRVDQLVPGENTLLVIPWDPLLGTSGLLTVDPTAERDGRMRVELPSLVPVTVTVRDTDGSPSPGTQVIAAEEIPERHGRHMNDLREMGIWRDVNSIGPTALARGITDDNGALIMHLPAALEEFQILATGAHPDTRVEANMPTTNPRTIEVLVPSRVAVSGTIQTPDGDIAKMGLYFRRMDTSIAIWGVPEEGLVRLDADGGFTTRLDPGRYAAVFVIAPREELGETSVRIGSGWRETEPALEEFVVTQGSPVTLLLNAQAYIPGSLSGTLRVHGELVAGAKFRIGGSSGPFVDHYTDADGFFRIPDLEPGEVHIRYRGPESSPWTTEAVSTQTTTVERGGEARLDVDFRPRTVRIRVMDSTGSTPLGDTKLELSTSGGSRPGTTDADGWIEYTYLNIGRCTIHIREGRSLSRSQPMEITSGDGTLTLEARMEKIR